MQVIAVFSAVFRKTGAIIDKKNMRTRWRILDSGDVGSVCGSSSSNCNRDDSGRQRPCLIVCPKTVVDNWVKEFEKWGYFKVDVLQSGRARAQEAEDILLRAKQGLLHYLSIQHILNEPCCHGRVNRSCIAVVFTSRSFCYGVIAGFLEETFLHTNMAMMMFSYDVLVMHLNSPQIAWDIAVYDEVHILKNEKSLKYISIMK